MCSQTTSGNNERNDEQVYNAVRSIVGSSFAPDRTWEEMGVTSMGSVELHSTISQEFHVPLPTTFLEDLPTPNALKSYVQANRHQVFKMNEESLEIDMENTGQTLSPSFFGSLQVLGVCLLLCMISFSFVPAYQVGKAIASTPSLNHSMDRIQWQWLPLIIPTWMLSMSTMTLLCKWIIIGQYKEQNKKASTVYFFRWWFVDRMVQMWEYTVGWVIKDTFLITVFYVMMGAKIDFSARVNAFFREFDLIHVGAMSNIQSDITCHRFLAWSKDDESEEPILRFRKIDISIACEIKGHVSPGSTLGKFCYVGRLASVATGSQIPDYVNVKGNPAYHGGSSPLLTRSSRQSFCQRVVEEIIKTIWLVVELYLFFTFLLFGQWLLNDRLPQGFRYSPLLYWFLMLMITLAMSMLTCILLKWVLIGKKKAGPVSVSLYRVLTDWCVDYHYRTSLRLFVILFNKSKLVNLYLKALGMDIDMHSQLWAEMMTPSKLDLLVSIKKSFLSIVFFDTITATGEYAPIEINRCSCGYRIHIHAGTKLSDSLVAPQSEIEGGETIQGTYDGWSYNEEHPQSLWKTDACILVFLIPVLFVCFIPAFELFGVEAADPLGLGFSVTKFACVLLVQTLCWMLLLIYLQSILLKKNSESGDWEVASSTFCGMFYPLAYWLVWQLSMLSLTFGTPLINAYLLMLGAKIEGRLLYLANSTYDFPLLTFADRTIIDGGSIMAHSGSLKGLVVSETKVAGTIHPGTVLLANADVTNQAESGPYKVELYAKKRCILQDKTDLDSAFLDV